MQVERMCVACRNRKPKEELVRIANDNGYAKIDNLKKCSGRAVYVCKNEKCVNLFIKSNAVKRLLKTDSSNEFYNILFDKIKE